MGLFFLGGDNFTPVAKIATQNSIIGLDFYDFNTIIGLDFYDFNTIIGLDFYDFSIIFFVVPLKIKENRPFADCFRKCRKEPLNSW